MVPRSVAFKREHGIFSGIATRLLGTQKIATEEEEKWSWGEKSGSCLRSDKWIAGSEVLGLQISRIPLPEWHLKFLRNKKQWRKKMPGKCLCVVYKVDDGREDMAGQTV